MNKQNRKENAANKQNECNAASGVKEHVKIFDGFVVQIRGIIIKPLKIGI